MSRPASGVHVASAVIHGERVLTDELLDVTDPADGTVFAQIARCQRTEVDRAVDSAREAFERSWRRTAPSERSQLLRRLASLIRHDKASLAVTESQDAGKPIRQAEAELETTARFFDFYADVGQAFYGDSIPLGGEIVAYTVREPLGVTGHITPWNFPIALAARTLAPALAAGNCCVLKPAEEACLTTVRLAELVLEAGFPPGTMNVCPGLGEEAGAALAQSEGIRHLYFTGSQAVGRLVSQAAGANCVSVTVELGGKSPNIVFADAPAETAIPSIVASITTNAGQVCHAGSRLLVQAQMHGRLVEAIADRFQSMTIGPGNENPDLEPLISRAQLQRVRGYVDQGRSEAALIVGGETPAEERLNDGFFIRPTLFDEVPPDATIAREEIFGPVLAVTPFDTVEQAYELAEGTSYGLVAAVWTRDIDKAMWLARELRAGQVLINSYAPAGFIELPFGGFKLSGHGREKGLEALHDYTQTKAVAIKVQRPVD